MSGVPSSSWHPHSVIHRVSRSLARSASSGTSYKPSREATAGRTLVVASSQHTDPYERSARRIDQWATSNELGSHNTGSWHVRRTLNYSSTGSRVKDNERIISELRREIHDLRQEARNRSPVKERSRNKVNLSKRKNLEYSFRSPDSHTDDCVETSSSQLESRSSVLRTISKQRSRLGRHSRSRPPPYHQGRGPSTKEQVSRKAACAGEKHAVWKTLDLVSSTPFSKEIEGQTYLKDSQLRVLKHTTAEQTQWPI